MQTPLRILITNITLASRTGTELYVRDLACGLLARGHRPVVYSTDMGVIAQELRRATVPVIESLDQMGNPPDLIHGHHNIETMTALLYFPQCPAIAYCHDNLAWHDKPPIFPRILRYVAIDETGCDRLTLEYGIDERRVEVLPNPVDVRTFQPRSPLPPKPHRALIFNNHASEATYVPLVREACRNAGLSLDVIGKASERVAEHPEKELRRYDLVFATGRSALEALAVGTAVVLCDGRGLGPMVTLAEWERLRRLNLGGRTLQEPLTAEGVRREIVRYNAVDAMQVAACIRATAGMERFFDETLNLYGRVLTEYRQNLTENPLFYSDRASLEKEERAAAQFLRSLSGHMRERASLLAEVDRFYKSRTFKLQRNLGSVPVIGHGLKAVFHWLDPSSAFNDPSYKRVPTLHDDLK